MASLAHPSPTILLIPEALPLDPDDWMVHWGAGMKNASLVADAHARLSALNSETSGPMLIVARGRACQRTAAAIAHLDDPYGQRPAGALFVAPGTSEELTPRLNIPSVVVASQGEVRSLLFASAIGARLVQGGDIGRADATASLGDWDYGRYVLNWLIASTTEAQAGRCGAWPNTVAPPDGSNGRSAGMPPG
ncbi:alpha/beta hydrolase [Sphingomonas colocasiae]|uniref:Alpha/beta hydrolase n=1 Tax=Sphingomonas colocasiae TaxID=1848973 RepID=A0ABS7PWL0_9SPHN|nr:alpha/beta hydrolase [Sphingomonas colocasiae]MBY8825743.1 alpha/beta hydrolase [Sphingomonas colocasiae]